MEKKEISLKSGFDYAGAVKFLEDLLASFKQRSVVLIQGPEHVALKPGDFVDVEIEAREKKGRQKLSIEMSWLTAAPAVEPQGFTISAVAPEPPASPEEPVEAPGADEAGCEPKAGGKKGKKKGE